MLQTRDPVPIVIAAYFAPIYMLMKLEDRARELEREEEPTAANPYSSASDESSDEREEIHALFTSLVPR